MQIISTLLLLTLTTFAASASIIKSPVNPSLTPPCPDGETCTPSLHPRAYQIVDGKCDASALEMADCCIEFPRATNCITSVGSSLEASSSDPEYINAAYSAGETSASSGGSSSGSDTSNVEVVDSAAGIGSETETGNVFDRTTSGAGRMGVAGVVLGVAVGVAVMVGV